MDGTELSSVECRDRLAARQVGRVVFTEQALPTAMPVPYVVHEDGVVFRVPATGRLARSSAQGSVVAFQVDDVDETGELGWTVLVVGFAELVPRPPAVRRLRAARSEDEVYVRVPFSRISGCLVGTAARGTTDA